MLFSSYHKHGKIVFTLPDGTMVTFTETDTTTIKIKIPSSNKNNKDDDHGLTQGQMIGISIGGAVFGVLIIGGILFL
jgi:hypothetical protein